ncbi:hypothetical protein GCM10010869_44730 [Mesorhizobium tianshanense]|uniref:hypothetical protein n=1 Tax=Mesorhizobium tianshanense TaxID=39844 RepID=UPI0012DCE9D7|nr:hypothetical protein [Mesorhizobium tianshanense]GLS38876.1 hypothetical protein GCM10010869_44730 [Mesorhizobium tianshanense]
MEAYEITHIEGSTHWMPGANDAGRTAWVSHEPDAVLDPVKDFLAQVLRERRNA